MTNKGKKLLAWLGFLIALFSGQLSFGQISYNLSLGQQIKNDTLFLQVIIQNQGTTFALGNSAFEINLPVADFKVAKAVIVSASPWGNNTSYNSPYLNIDAVTGELDLIILKKTAASGSGVNVPSVASTIATIAVPVRTCTASASALWKPIPDLPINTWTGTNITNKANFINPVPLTSLCDTSISTTLKVSPNDSICKGDTVTFQAFVNTIYDLIEFYKDGVLVQTGTSDIYKIINPPDGTKVYAIASRCTCSGTSQTITITADDIQVNLGNDRQICSQSIGLDAGSAAPGIKYLWNTGASTQKITVSTPGTYSVMVYRPGGCYKRDTINILPHNAMQYPFVSVGSVTATSIQFTWGSDPNALTYQFSTDSTTWTDNTAFTQTVGSQLPNTTICAWVRSINKCDTVVSVKTCGTTLGVCKISYSKTKDTAVCTTGNVTVSLKGIVPPSYKISWQGGAYTRSTSYTTNVTGDITIYFTVQDTSLAACQTSDSIRINYVPVNDAAWTGLSSSYCTASYSSILTPHQMGGTFTGPGVSYNTTSNVWYFKPSAAGPGTYTITYTICGLSTSQTTTVQAAPCVTSVVSDSTSSAIQTPQGLYTDCIGQIYVTNAKNNVISLIDTLGNARVIAGDSSFPGGYVDGPLITARINQPIGITVGPDGTVYFVDGGNQSVRMMQGGKIITLAGGPPPVPTAGNVPGGGGTVTGATARFNKPFGITMNSTYTKLYVSDQGNTKIREIDLTPPYNVRTIIGGGGTNITNPAGITGLSAKLYRPSHLSADSRYLYIADEDAQAVYVYEFATNLVKPYAGVFGSSGNTLGTTFFAQFNGPSGVSVSCNGDLYVVDKNNHSIKLVDPNTYAPQRYVYNFAGGNSPIASGDVDGSPSVARFNTPQAVSVFVKGFIDIADTGNDKIKRFSIQDYSQRPWQNLQSDMTYCIGDKVDTLHPPCGGAFSGPGIRTSGGVVTFDAALAGAGVHTLSYTYTTGYCVETSTQQVTVYSKPAPVLSPAASLVCANQFGSYQLDAGGPFSSYTWYKNGTTDPSSVVRSYTVKTIGQYVVKVTNAGGCIGTDTLNITSKPSPKVAITAPADTICFGGTITLSASATGQYPVVGYNWNTGNSGNSLQAQASGDYIVTAIASNGCTDRDTFRLIEKNAPGICMTVTSGNGTSLGYGLYNVSTLAGPGLPGNANVSFSGLWDVYLDHSGQYLYITEEASRNDIRRLRLSDTSVTVFAGTPSTGNYTNGTLAGSFFNHPYGIVQNSNGEFFLCDRLNNDVRKIAPASNTVATAAGYLGPLPALSGTRDGQDTAARFYSPFDIVMDNFSNLYISDYDNHKIRRINSAGYVSTFSGDTSASPANAVVNGTKFKARYSWPVGLAFDVAGSLYVTDEGGHTLRKIDMDGTVTPVAGMAGVSGFANGTGTTARFFNPWTLVTDKSGNVFLVDRANNAIRKIDNSGNVTTIAGTNTAGFADGPGANARFSIPRGITINPLTEVLYVTDNGNNKIRTLTKNKTISICQGDSVNINASCSNMSAYQWSPSTGLSNTNIANPVAFPSTTTTYYLKVSDRSGCTNIDSITILVNPKPVANAGSDAILCSGDSVKIGSAAVAGNSYKWTPSISPAKDTLANPYAKPLVSANYIITVTNKTTGCKSTDTAAVKVISRPVADAGPDSVNVCLHDSISIGTASVAGNTYTWTPSTYLSNASIATPRTSPPVTQKYYLTVTSTALAGCAGKDSIKVKVLPLPIASAGTDTTLCQRASKQMGITGNVNNTYQWSPATGLSPSAIISNPVATPLSTITYILTVKDKNTLCVNKDTAIITVKPLPVVSAGQDQTICAQDSALLGTAPAAANTTYSWSPATGLSNAAIPNPKAAPAVTTQYIVTAASTVTGCSLKDTVNITVNPRPKASFTVSNACTSDTTSFTNTSTLASGTLSYSWNFGDPASGVKNTAVSKNVNHIYSTGNAYTVKLVTVSNAGCKDSTTVTVTPLPKPLAGFTYVIPCAAGPVVFNDTTSASASRTWNFGDPASNGSNTASAVSASHTFAGVAPFNVSLMMTATNGCKDTATVKVNPAYLKATAMNDKSICLGDTAFLTASGTGGNTSGYAFSWTGTALISTAGANVKAVPDLSASPYTYVVSLNDGNCTSTDTVIITVLPLPAVNAGLDTAGICTGKSISLGGAPTASSASGIKTLIWTPGLALNAANIPNPTATPASSTQYVVSATDSSGCSNSDTIFVQVNPLPLVSISQDKPTGCAGSQILLSIPVSDRGYTIRWKNITAGSTVFASDTIFASVSSEATYGVVVTNPVTGCADSSVRAVDFILPPSGLSIIAPASACINEPLNLSGTVAGDSLRFLWTGTGAGTYSGTDALTTTYKPAASDISPASFTLAAWNSCDTLTATQSVILNPAPVGSFTYQPARIMAYDTVSFTNTSDLVTYNIVKWIWDFKDGSIDSSLSPAHTFLTAGTYNVGLTVINNFGCKDTATLPVEIRDMHIIYVPNTFNPYATNPENRTCKVYGLKLSPAGFNWKIYNRWGELVYETSDFTEATQTGWDGTDSRKEPQSMGVFTYVIKAEWIDGRPVEKTGTITLMR